MTVSPSHLDHAYDSSRWGALILLATARISVSTPSRDAFGSAFFVDRLPNAGGGPVLITARHVIDDATTGRVHLLPLTPTPGLDLTVDFGPDDWVTHPTADVAALPMSDQITALVRSGTTPLFARYRQEMFPTVEDMKYVEAFEDVVFIGFPGGLWDTVNRTPTVRRGITATPIWQDFQGRQEFIIDGAVFPGNSGGPALMVHRNGFNGPNGFEVGRIRTILLGVVVQSTQLIGGVSDGGRIVGTVAQPASIATVVKWTRILETLALLPLPA